MKFSTETINVLKHFASLNPGLIFTEGSDVLSQTINKTIRAEVQIDEHIPKEFAVSNLTQFINTMTILDDPEVEFKEDHLEITDSSGLQSIKYHYSNPVLVKQDNKKFKGLANLKITSEFMLPKEILAKANKVCGVIGCNDICFFNEGKTLYIACQDKKDPKSNQFKIEIGQHSGEVDFKAYIKKTNLNILPEDYNVTIIARGLALFTAVNSVYKSLQFAVSIEEDSVLGPTE